MRKIISTVLISASLLSVSAFADIKYWGMGKNIDEAKKECEKSKLVKKYGYSLSVYWDKKKKHAVCKFEKKQSCEKKTLWSSTKPDGNGDNQRADENRCYKAGGIPSASYDRDSDETTVTCEKKVCN